MTTNEIYYRFIVYQVRQLIAGPTGEIEYVDEFDRIIYDFYGVKGFSKKMANGSCYYPNDYYNLINRVGMSKLIALLSSKKYCQILRDLIYIDVDMHKVKRKIRKAQQNGKSNKSLMKEYNYLLNLYRKGMKILRKRLGLKSQKHAYKRHYQAVRGFVDENRGGYGFNNFGAFDGFDYDPYSGQGFYDDYEDDDYEETNELQDFIRMMNGPKKSNRKPTRRQPQYNPYEERMEPEYSSLDPYFDDDPEGFLDDWGEYTRKRTAFDEDDDVEDLDEDELYTRINYLQKQAESRKARKNQDLPVGSDLAVAAELKLLTQSVSDVVAAVRDLQEWKEDLEAEAMELPDDEDEEEVIVDSEAKVYMDKINKYQNPYEDIDAETDKAVKAIEAAPAKTSNNKKKGLQPKKEVDSLTREEVIEEINESEPQTISVPKGDAN